MGSDQVPITIKEASPVVPQRFLERSHRVTVISCFLAIYVIWGSTYLAIRYAVESIPPLYTAGLRHLAAGSILLVWCLAKRLRPTWAQIRASIIIGVFFFLIGHGTLHWAEQKVPPGLAADCQRAHLGLFAFCRCLEAVALERFVVNRKPFRPGWRGSSDGAKRAHLGPWDVYQLARCRHQRALVVHRGGLFT